MKASGLKHQWTCWCVAASAGLSGCALIPLSNEPVAHTVHVNGDAYVLKQITAGTWTATAAGSLKTLAGTSAGTAHLQEAVEKTSGCKVTDSDYSREGKQFDAQVDCGSRIAT